MKITELEQETAKRMGCAKQMVEQAVAHRFLRHNGCYCCDYAGRLLAVVNRADSPDQFVIHLMDADDLLISRWCKDEAEAMRLFDQLLPAELLIDGDVFEILVRYGFN